MFGQSPPMDVTAQNTLLNQTATSSQRGLFSTFRKPSQSQPWTLNASQPLASSSAQLIPSTTWPAQWSKEPTGTQTQSGGRVKDIIITVAGANTDPDQQPSTGWQAVEDSAMSLIQPRVRIEVSSCEGWRGLLGMEKTEAYPMPSVIGSVFETGREYMSLAWQSACAAVQASAAWLTESLIPTVARAYSYMCGDPVDLGDGHTTGVYGQPPPSYSTVTAASRSIFSGNLPLPADRKPRPEREHKGRHTYETLFGASDYDADVLCQVRDGKFSVKPPHAWTNRKTIRNQDDWIHVFDVPTDKPQDFGPSYLRQPTNLENQYQIEDYCDRSKPQSILNKTLSDMISDWVSHERATYSSMRGEGQAFPSYTNG